MEKSPLRFETLPSLNHSIGDFDFVGSSPIVRRGMVDIFGTADSPSYSRRNLFTPPEIRSKIHFTAMQQDRVRERASRQKSNKNLTNKSEDHEIHKMNADEDAYFANLRMFNNSCLLSDVEKAEKKAAMLQRRQDLGEHGNRKKRTPQHSHTSESVDSALNPIHSSNISLEPLSTESAAVAVASAAQDQQQTADELDNSFDTYFGHKSRIKFHETYTDSHVNLSKYPDASLLPLGEMSSPSAIYLREITKEHLLPLPLLLRKEKNPKGVFLGNKGLGDTRVLPVVTVIDKLPAVETIDLCDNRLTDISLMPLALKLRSMKHLTHLDLSFNKIDESSATLMEFLQSKDCKLGTLLMNGADVDDGESVNFFNAILHNKSIKNLGLSRNLIGNSELRSSMDPTLETGGAALAQLLKKNKYLATLDLSWNCIQQASAVRIGTALISNRTLKVLNLGHNAFGDLGTQMIGSALRVNKTLEELDLSANGITPKAALVLGNGLFHNETLKSLVVDGNLLGRLGAQALVGAIQRSSGGDNRNFRVHFNNCDCRKEVPGLFDASQPAGTWAVDMSEPYGQMVVEECIFLANTRAGCSIDTLEWNRKKIVLGRLKDETVEKKFSLPDFLSNSKDAAKFLLSRNFKGSSKSLEALLAQFDFHMDEDKRFEVLMKVRDNWRIKQKQEVKEELHEVFLFEVFFALFVINDKDCSCTMEVDEFVHTLVGLGRESMDHDRCRRLMAEHDKDDSGTIDANEFGMIMVNDFCRTDVPKSDLVDKATGKTWTIPTTGTCTVKLLYQCEAPSVFDVGDDEGIDNILRAIKDAKSIDQKMMIFEQATSSPYYFFTADQGQMLFDSVSEFNKSTMDSIASILPQLVNEEHVRRFVDMNLNDYGKLALRVRLGQLFNAYVGMPTGHYSIDLKDHIQMQGGRRLAAISAAETKFCKQLNIDTSQKHNWSSFRNEQLGGVNVNLTGAWFAQCKSRAMLHCDFASTTRPRQGTLPLSAPRFHKMLHRLQLDKVRVAVNAFMDEFGGMNDEDGGDLVSNSLPAIHRDTTIERPVQAGNVKNPLRASIDQSIRRATIRHNFEQCVGGLASSLVTAPLTYVCCKDQFTEYMETCHHYLDIYPEEKCAKDSKWKDLDIEHNPLGEMLGSMSRHKPSLKMPPFYPVALRALFEIQVMMPSTFLSVEQVIAIMAFFPEDGYMRVQVLQAVFSHITDIENLNLIIDERFSNDEQREAFFRMGMLNLFDPLKPDRYYILDLRRWDHREVCKILIALAVAEPGENWLDVDFRWFKFDEPVPGWALPSSWAVDDPDGDGRDGPRNHGWLRVRYTSEGDGCAPVLSARKQLRHRTLAGIKRVL